MYETHWVITNRSGEVLVLTTTRKVAKKSVDLTWSQYQRRHEDFKDHTTVTITKTPLGGETEVIEVIRIEEKAIFAEPDHL